MSDIQSVFIDVTTQNINTSLTTTRGSKNSFTSTIPTVLLVNKNYNVTVLDFRYPTTDLREEFAFQFYGAAYSTLTTEQQLRVTRRARSVTPLLTCNIGRDVIVNGSYAPLLFKGTFGSDTEQFGIDTGNTSSSISVKISDSRLTEVSFQLVRSDNGQPYPFLNDPTEPEVFILIALNAIDQPMAYGVNARGQPTGLPDHS